MDTRSHEVNKQPTPTGRYRFISPQAITIEYGWSEGEIEHLAEVYHWSRQSSFATGWSAWFRSDQVEATYQLLAEHQAAQSQNREPARFLRYAYDDPDDEENTQS